ncbi:hypothetical protein PV10_06319 [Exophiala mesophila]|uniref:Uncharacterized protein n=1 Tax=Exophiala mesophila TaxID=212818 RepID=A0A0D1ZAW4_EXOME|nr:uncharacterized protein PV10_06319 [Exophiala mesophila]KIV91822.1 hypothetical protein PV10_06319 [Exophiala mesophila]
MAFCTYCGREFARNEHLERHVRTHTKVRPYKCLICHGSFTRSDLLQKHYLSHTEKEVYSVKDLINPRVLSDHSNYVPNNQQITVACTNCAKSKTRCDHKQPCGRCKAKGLTCETRLRRNARVTYSDPNRLVQPSPRQGSGDNESDAPQDLVHVSPAESENARDSLQSDNVSATPFDSYQQNSSLPQNGGGGESAKSPQNSALTTGVLQDLPTALHRSPSAAAGAVPINPSASFLSLQPAGVDTYADLAVNGGWDWMLRIETPLPDTPSQTLRRANDISNGGMQNLYPNTTAGTAVDNGELVLPVDHNLGVGNGNGSPDDVNLFALDLNFMSPMAEFQGMTSPMVSYETSTMSDPDLMEQWTMGKCIPHSKTVTTPSDASDIFDLDSSYNDAVLWSQSIDQFRSQTFQQFELITHVPLTETTREWMLVVIQNFLSITLEAYGVKMKTQPLRGSANSAKRTPDLYLFLPHKNYIHRWLDVFLASYDPFYPMIPTLTLNPNSLATSSNERGATLLLLLMIASGSMLDPSPKARRFSRALFEICRHALADIFANDSAAYKSSLNLQCAFLFSIGGAFSGWSTYMNLVVGQKNLYLATMRQANFFSSPPAFSTHLPCHTLDLDALWRAWVDRETAIRLTYCWIIADQEISLFYDAPLCLALSDLNVLLPCDEKLWLAPCAAKWMERLGELGISSVEAAAAMLEGPQPTLRDLLVRLSATRAGATATVIHPSHLRLLLYPLQLLVVELRQFWALFGSENDNPTFPLPLLQTSSSLRAEELERLLHRWMDLAESVQPEGVRSVALMKSTMILYHLVFLNLLTSLTSLEAIARGEGHLSAANNVSRWLRGPEPILVHCGQVLSLTADIDKKLRPNWWAAAIYRVAITMWAYGASGGGGDEQHMSQQHAPEIVLNTTNYRDRLISDYLRTHSGRPYLRNRVGNLVSLSDTAGVLQVCIEALEPGPRMCRFTEGCLRRLEAVAKIRMAKPS